jgi:AbrB family looped-hinge helix DNA binding protein
MRLTSRVTSKGQITIPRAIREKFGMLPNTMIEFVIESKGPRLKRAQGANTRGTEIVARMKKSRRAMKLSSNVVLQLVRGED